MSDFAFVQELNTMDKYIEYAFSCSCSYASSPTCIVETAVYASVRCLAKARSAAFSGDKETLGVELYAAIEIWPYNGKFTKMLFSLANVQSAAIMNHKKKFFMVLQELSALPPLKNAFQGGAVYNESKDSFNLIMNQMI